MLISGIRSYEDLYRYHAVEGPGVAIQLVGTLGMVGLLLASAGLYGLMAHNVNRRTREIGIRMAIGATKRDVVREPVGTGTLIGLAMGFGVERLVNSMVFDPGRIRYGRLPGRGARDVPGNHAANPHTRANSFTNRADPRAALQVDAWRRIPRKSP